METVCPNLNNSVNLQDFAVESENPGLTGNIQKSLVTFFYFQWMCEREREGERTFRKGKGLWIKCELVLALFNRLRLSQTWKLECALIFYFTFSNLLACELRSRIQGKNTRGWPKGTCQPCFLCQLCYEGCDILYLWMRHSTIILLFAEFTDKTNALL